jgi:2-methylcitrate dehydratase PrpD
VRGSVGLDAFTDEAVKDPRALALAAKVRYEIDPDNPYPHSFTGHVRALLRNGQMIEERQPHLRGGASEPLTRQDIEEKFVRNARHGGWAAERIDAALKLTGALYDGPVDLSVLHG